MPGRTFSAARGVEHSGQRRPGTPLRPPADAISPLTEPYRSPAILPATTTSNSLNNSRPVSVFLPPVPQHTEQLPPPCYLPTFSTQDLGPTRSYEAFKNAQNPESNGSTVRAWSGASLHSSVAVDPPSVSTLEGGPSSPKFPKYVEPPPPMPIDESDNPDAIALRAAMSVLLLQRERSKEDIKTLRTMKEKALEMPELFVEELQAGKIKSVGAKSSVLEEDFGNLPRRRRVFRATENAGDDYSDMGVPDDAMEFLSETDSEDSGEQNEPEGSKFGKMPAPQNVVRCPPINWAKYHVVGESLDKLHEEQTNRPTPGEPHRYLTSTDPRAPEAIFAAPYNPLTDRIIEGMTTRSATKKAVP